MHSEESTIQKMVHFTQVEIVPFQRDVSPNRLYQSSRDRIVLTLDCFERLRYSYGSMQFETIPTNKRRYRRGGRINRRSMKASSPTLNLNKKAATMARQRLSEIQDEIDRLHRHLKAIDNKSYSIEIVRH